MIKRPIAAARGSIRILGIFFVMVLLGLPTFFGSRNLPFFQHMGLLFLPAPDQASAQGNARVRGPELLICQLGSGYSPSNS
jgi:hypothetical protein